ncbi:hypothetical protein LO763_01795 [Glycomyces sp. A-F 0318]|uniref:hypothetical protein n=1 Tax=Glycomyces amatae TaxID=2881355 RepID=UPI001E2AAC5B|nr:hypothetical protein [Glycomyces amatae]MCD0442359.1 hypothetical protein [Glycomyces amatae]
MPVSLGEALLMLGATVVGSAAVIAVCVLAAVGLSSVFGRFVGPAPPEPTPEERLRRAEAQQEEDKALESRWQEREHGRGRDYVDSTHVSFRVFGWVFAAVYLLVGLSSILAHVADPGEGFPMQLAARPLWVAFLVAIMAGIVAGSRYQRRFRRMSRMDQREFLARQRARLERERRGRLDGIRRHVFPGR